MHREGFVTALRQHAARRLTDEGLLYAFLESVFFCQAPQHPGFLAVPARRGPVIGVYTSETELARHAGPCRWFSSTGADLVALAPVGHLFVVDPGAPHEVLVDPSIFIERVSGPAA